MVTDSTATFAILTYNDPEQTMNITTDHRGIGVIGFDAGDFQRSTTLLSSEQTSFPLNSSNIFRIDGEKLFMYVAIQSAAINSKPRILCRQITAFFDAHYLD